MADQDPQCTLNTTNNPSVFDTTLIPTFSSLNDPSFNILPFLCQLLKVANNDNIDPVLVPPAEYDDSQHVNFSALTGVGDKRFTDGAVLSAAFIKFLPRIITQMEVGRSGGTQIVNNYICDSDGNPIKQSLTVPVMTTVGTGGVNILGYDIPSGLDTTELMKPLNTEEVFDFVNEYMLQQSQIHADAFISYLVKNYPITSGWSYSLHAFKNPPFFYIELEHKTNNKNDYSVYLKYYDNVQDYVAKQLSNIGYINSNASIDVRIGATFDNNAIARAFLTPIPDYLSLLNDDKATSLNQQNVQSFYTVTPNQQFTNYSAVSSGLNQKLEFMNFDLNKFINNIKY